MHATTIARGVKFFIVLWFSVKLCGKHIVFTGHVVMHYNHKDNFSVDIKSEESGNWVFREDTWTSVSNFIEVTQRYTMFIKFKTFMNIFL